MKYIPTMTA